MTLEEALQKAAEAIDKGYLNPYPMSCVVLAKEVRRLQKLLAKAEKNEKGQCYE